MTAADIITNSASALPAYILLSSLLEGIIFQDNRGLLFFIVLCVNFIINILLKTLLWELPGSHRPNENATCGDKYGNPSSHAQFIWCFAIFWILYITQSNIFLNPVANILSSVSLILIALIVSLSRVSQGCHTLLQVFFGAIAGIIVAIIAFFACKKLLMAK